MATVGHQPHHSQLLQQQQQQQQLPPSLHHQHQLQQFAINETPQLDAASALSSSSSFRISNSCSVNAAAGIGNVDTSSPSVTGVHRGSSLLASSSSSFAVPRYGTLASELGSCQYQQQLPRSVSGVSQFCGGDDQLASSERSIGFPRAAWDTRQHHVSLVSTNGRSGHSDALASVNVRGGTGHGVDSVPHQFRINNSETLPSWTCAVNDVIPQRSVAGQQGNSTRWNCEENSAAHVNSWMDCNSSNGHNGNGGGGGRPQCSYAAASATLIPRQLPESPPDSGSEPYSPPDGNQTVDNKLPRYSDQNPQCLPHLSRYGSNNFAPQAHAPLRLGHSASMPSPLHAHLPQHGRGPPYGPYGPNIEGPRLVHPAILPTHSLPPAAFMQMNSEMLQSQMAGMQCGAQYASQYKKRKHSESPNNTLSKGTAMPPYVGMPFIKQEPSGVYGDCSDDAGDEYGDWNSEMASFLDGSGQVIKWLPYQPDKWATLLDHNHHELPHVTFRVDADKGFNYSPSDDAFVCQKKNHFQVTVHIVLCGLPKYVRVPNCDEDKPIDCFYIHFEGVKMESQSQIIRIEQSQSDRSKRPFYPVKADIVPDQLTKLTVGRLHFSETTTNNMRKKGKPNPDQRYFLLVVSLRAHCGDESYALAAQSSEKIIVRASNPGQFEGDDSVVWARGTTPESVFHMGRVGINTDRPDEALTIHGNVKVIGDIVTPSDKRVKVNVQEMDTQQQKENISKLKIYHYSYDTNFAEYAGLTESERQVTGVLAQEVRQILPDAVRETCDVTLPSGDIIENFQVVNKDRIYMENVGAVKELCKVTDTLQMRIGELEVVNKKLASANANKGSVRSLSSCKSVSTCSTASVPANVTMPKKEAVHPAITRHHHHHRHCHRCHHLHHSGSCSHSAGSIGWCAGRFVQISIIILILVMSFCLCAITVLYVTEKTSDGPTSDFSDSSLILSSNGSFSTSLSQVTNWSPYKFNITTPLPSGYPTSAEVITPELLKPHWCNIKTCEKVCCSEQKQCDPEVIVVIKPWEKSQNEVNDKSVQYHYNRKNNKDNVSHFKRRKLPYFTTTASSDLLTMQYMLNNKSKDAEFKKNERNSVHRNKRSVSKVINYGSEILLLSNINLTLTSEYCANANCANNAGRNYSYFVPLSSLFPRMNLTLEFLIPNNLHVNLCSQLHDASYCSYDPTLNANKLNQLSWNLPVGYYHRSNYVFRVASSHYDSTLVCGWPNSSIRSLFLEYSVTMARICQEEGTCK